MLLSVRSIALLSTTCLVSVLMVGCGESKVAQCNKLTTIVNKVEEDTGSKAIQVDELTQGAGRLDGYTEELAAIELKDENLKDYQRYFVKMYQDASKYNRDLVSVFNRKDYKAADNALKSRPASMIQELALVADLNKYCTGN